MNIDCEKNPTTAVECLGKLWDEDIMATIQVVYIGENDKEGQIQLYALCTIDIYVLNMNIYKGERKAV